MPAAELEQLARLVRARRALPPPDECRRIREAAGIARSEVAPLVGVTARAVGQWERGERRPRADHLQRYLAVLLAIQEAASRVAAPEQATFGSGP